MNSTIQNKKADSLDPHLIKICMIMMVGIIPPAMDATIVDVAVQTIGTEMNSPISMVQWIATAYILAMGITVPFAGWLDNRFSIKKIYIVALCIFLVGSILSALSWDIRSLIVFRIVQGCGAGILLPTLQSAIIQYAWGQKLGSLMAIIGVPMLIVPILGPVIGGFIVNKLPWRWIFYVNIPFSIIALLLTVHLPKTAPVNDKQRPDAAGMLLSSAFFILFILAISELQSSNNLFSLGFLLLFAAGIACFILFVVYSLKTKMEPAIDVRLYKLGSFSASSVLFFTSAVVSTGTLFILPLFFQQVQHETSFAAGLMLAPQGIGMLLTRGAAGKLTDRIGAGFVVIGGLIVTAIGTVPFLFAGPETGKVFLMAALLVRGAGLGGVTIPIMASIYDELKQDEITHGTIVTRILQQIGGAFGTAILSMQFQHYLPQNASSPELVGKAFNLVFVWSLGFTVVSIIPALALIRTRDREASGSKGSAERPAQVDF
ncbi:MAG: multidrug efflux MFS transporter [Treponema sp.]|jgi:EmrB/QacA subfamily drug resistance transporter|nr:multidrug efflux MFS transporter [Treponema sp.]